MADAQFYDKIWKVKKGIAMCQSSYPSEFQNMINSEIKCNAIYSKPYEHGTLYGLVLSAQVSHKRLSANLLNVENSIVASSGVQGAKFRSISNDPFGGKIKTFQKGEHSGDPYFSAIFNTRNPGGGRDLVAHSDVHVWKPTTRESEPDWNDMLGKSSADLGAEPRENKRRRTAENEGATVATGAAVPQVADDLLDEGAARMAMIASASLEEQNHRQSMLAELEAEVEQLTSKAARSKERMQRYKDKLAAARDEVGQLKVELADALREVRELTANGAKGDVLRIMAPWDDERCHAEYRKLEGEMREQRARMRELEREVEWRQKKLEECSPQHVASLKAELAASQKEVGALRDRAGDFTDRERELESDIVDYRYEIELLKEALLAEKGKKKLETPRREEEGVPEAEELAKLRGQFEALNERYADLKRVADKDGAALHDLDGLCQDQRKKIERLEATIMYYEQKTRIKNLDLLAPDDPVRQLDQDYRTLQMDHRKLSADKARLMDEVYRLRVAANQTEGELVDQVRQEKRDAHDKTVALLLFVDEVIGKAGRWDELSILAGIETKVAAVVDAFSPGLEIKARTERVGRLKVIVQRFLSKALGY